jgi:two-component system CheB/CheR fusion protein
MSSKRRTTRNIDPRMGAPACPKADPEVSRAERQSLNEELTGINREPKGRAAVATPNDDLANMMNAMEIATVFLDRHLRITRFTPRAKELLHLVPNDIGRPVGDLTQNFPGVDFVSDAERVLASLSAAEKEVQSSDGQWYTVRSLPYRTADNRTEGVVITFSDVTRLKQAEGKLQYQKLYAESIVETVRDPLIVLDGRLQVISANQAYYRMFRTGAAETVGRRIYDLANRQWDIERLRHLLEEIIPEKSSFQDFRVESEFPLIGRKAMLLSGSQVRATDGMAECILLTMKDVTELERGRALAEHRAGQLRELAFQLTQTEQRERKRLAHVLHENLQQLLVAAKFHLESVRAHTPGGKSRESLEEVNRLLDQSVETSRGLTVELSPPILFELGMSAALPWLARQLERKYGLKVSTDIRADVPADEETLSVLLFSAVRELLFNVVKHSGADSAHVLVDRIDDGNIRVVVSDEGVGFDYAKFQAGENTEAGLGLFSIRERIEYLGGHLMVEPVPARGTRVTMVIPLRQDRMVQKEEVPVAGLSVVVAAGAAALPVSGRKIRVLLADDHMIVRQGLVGLLRMEEDIEVVAEAGDGRQAIELAKRDHPDVVVMDLSMPVVNGIEATRRIRADLPCTQIIGLSMYDETDRAEAMLAAGATIYLNKGGPTQDLVAAIRTAASASH